MTAKMGVVVHRMFIVNVRKIPFNKMLVTITVFDIKGAKSVNFSKFYI